MMAERTATTRSATRQAPSSTPHADNSTLGDLRFRALLGDADWARLPAAIRQRFSKRLGDGRTTVYVGRVTETRMSRAGNSLAQLARLIGGPLPISRDVDVPSVVTVTEDMARGGQVWTRLYAKRNGFPQVIHSAKRFAGPTGLEEHVGCGIGMTLQVRSSDRALIFESTSYFIEFGRLRLTLPRWLSPGALTVTHAEIDENRFAFTLDIIHPWLGSVIHQRAEFSEAGDGSRPTPPPAADSRSAAPAPPT
jgi:hypothetical protein